MKGDLNSNDNIKFELEQMHNKSLNRIYITYGTFRRFADKCIQLGQQKALASQDDNIFISHIKSHLKPNEEVICTLCKKTANEIIGTEQKSSQDKIRNLKDAIDELQEKFEKLQRTYLIEKGAWADLYLNQKQKFLDVLGEWEFKHIRMGVNAVEEKDWKELKSELEKMK